MKSNILLKLFISFFILFHWFCVVAWLMPKPSAVKTFFLSLRLPYVSRPLVSAYLYHTAMWQDWSMFAPDPLQVNRTIEATVHFQDGSQKKYIFPRLAHMNFLEAWIQKRYRKLEQRMIEETNPGFRRGLVRYVARQMNTDPANPPIKVVLNQLDSPVPRHDRPELKAPRPPRWINYTALLRQRASYTTKMLLDYPVKPDEDLR